MLFTMIKKNTEALEEVVIGPKIDQQAILALGTHTKTFDFQPGP